MHQLLTQFTVRWVALMTGAAHATTVLRTMARNAPEAEDDEDLAPRIPSVSAPRRQLAARRKPTSGWPRPA